MKAGDLMIFEVIVQNGQEAIQAEKLGADRLELVSAMEEGGLTPSYGAIKQVLESVAIPVQVMVRPHSYHFSYTDEDLKIIREDIDVIQKLGCNRIVFGALNQDLTINTTMLDELVQFYPNLDITFHRAFDEVPSQQDAYETLVKYQQNVKRILTSGGKANAEAGKQQLQELVEKGNGPVIMPGSGLTPANIKEIHEAVGATQYHFGKSVRVGNSFENGFDPDAMREVEEKLKG
ncbi:copper homeostasis protein CutC [Virgibacillus litoralis]|uniref:PF03932 family protein CutC n=1 Tax=Virgibacillus litoralis TaxID=578221 RepID=A0ABS4HFS3_9BACI|nr:copper homeostasis protein CutC [Virgibacillus litoralis]MBP1949767.1 copper homeostasis protein [Virgibacillus litoralis]